MSRRKLFFVLAALLFPSSTALARRYEIPTVVLPANAAFPEGAFPEGAFPEGVVATGFIETDGSIGPISADNIVDYRLYFEGVILATSPRTPQNSVLFSTGLLASDTDLFLESDESSSFSMTAPDFVFGNSFTWRPDLDSESTSISFFQLPGFGSSTLYEARVPYGIAIIPEPSTFALAGIALVGLAFRTSRWPAPQFLIHVV